MEMVYIKKDIASSLFNNQLYYSKLTVMMEFDNQSSIHDRAEVV